jgi:uncharacterized protein YjbI with pentapeptide repeats
MKQCKHFEVCHLAAETDQGAEDLCILHSKENNKSKEAFAKALEAHRKVRGDNFEFFVFPDIANFKGAKFSNDANFNKTTFRQRADFSKTHFSGDVNFKETIFEGRAVFMQAQFNGVGEFSYATFSEKTFLSFVIFNKDAVFLGAKFLARTNFMDTKFKGEAVFDHANFSKDVNFASAVFYGEAGFGGFIGAVFSGESDFGGAKFLGKTIFETVKFLGPVRFRNCEFRTITDFRETNFSDMASFRDAQFFEATSFNYAIFIGAVTFEKAVFYEEVDYSKSQFSDGADFRQSRFAKKAKFKRAEFLDDADFDGVSFLGKVIFHKSKFSGRLLFVGKGVEVPDSYIFSKARMIDFRDVNLIHPNLLIVRNADLRKCQFLGTDMRSAELTNIRWPEIYVWLGMNRIGVYDEILAINAEENRSFSHLERLYRELKQNFTTRGDHAIAGDFHYGEKEMCRLNPNTQTIHRFFLHIYWFLSGYGERYLRPLLWASLLLIGGTFIYMLLGMGPEGKDALSWKNPTNWVRVFLYSLEVMFLRKPTGLEPVSVAGRLIQVIHGLFGPLILAFFALAVRQRLKR